MPKKRQIEAEIGDVVHGRVARDALYYPGGRGGGGERRGGGSAVVLPHARTSSRCKLCTRYHTTAEHLRHAGKTVETKKSTGSAKSKKSTKVKDARRAQTTPARRKLGAADLRTPMTKMPLDPEMDRAPTRRKLGPADLRHPMTPMPLAPSPPPPPMSPEFVRIIEEGVRTMPSSGRFGPVKVFISELWDRVGAKLGISLDEFKRWLVPMNRDGHLVLARADLVGAMDPQKVARSELHDRNATFHFVVDPNVNY